MRKILFIGWYPGWSTEISDQETELIGTGFDAGTNHLEYEFYEHLAIHNIIKKTVDAEKAGFDAVVIGCFYDPGLREARELVEIPVVGVCEASLHMASMLSAGKFSVLVGRRKWIPKMSDNARNYGLSNRIASWRVLDLTVPDMKDSMKTQAAILRETKLALDDDSAECIVLGCTGMAGQAMRAQEKYNVPVLDPVLMGLKVAEMRADIWRNYGISHSKIGGYEAPSDDELKQIWKKVYSE